MKKCLLLLSLLVFTSAHAGELYRSIDSSGKVHYGDSPLPDSEDVEELKVGKEPTPDEPLPYETQRAKQNFPVTLYSIPSCASACTQARDFLNNRGIPYSEKSLLTQEDLDAFRKASGDSQIPAVSIGKTWIKGFLAEQWNNELDVAGYPKKVLTYRPPRPAAPATAQPAQ
jgi:glutaredoxin